MLLYTDIILAADLLVAFFIYNLSFASTQTFCFAKALKYVQADSAEVVSLRSLVTGVECRVNWLIVYRSVNTDTCLQTTHYRSTEFSEA